MAKQRSAPTAATLRPLARQVSDVQLEYSGINEGKRLCPDRRDVTVLVCCLS